MESFAEFSRASRIPQKHNYLCTHSQRSIYARYQHTSPVARCTRHKSRRVVGRSLRSTHSLNRKQPCRQVRVLPAFKRIV